MSFEKYYPYLWTLDERDKDTFDKSKPHFHVYYFTTFRRRYTPFAPLKTLNKNGFITSTTIAIYHKISRGAVK